MTTKLQQLQHKDKKRWRRKASADVTAGIAAESAAGRQTIITLGLRSHVLDSGSSHGNIV